MKTLRPYQEAAEASLFKYIFDNPNKHPLVVAPVAAGKSLMMANFIKRVHEQWPRTRIVMLTHIKELLEQNAEELDSQYFGADFAFYCAGLNQKRLHNDITFASIQSIHSKITDFNRVPEIIIIDECHLISHKSETQYRKFIDAALALNPNCRVIGYTGTPFRADTGRLDEGHNKLFDGVAYEIGMDYMIEQGYWTKPVCPEIANKMDLTGVQTRGGDYVEKQLQEAINTQEINDECVAELAKHGEKRKKWLVFTAGIEHAEDVTAALNAGGIEARCVHSKMPDSEVKQNLDDHRAGRYKALVNVAKLTTGYNDPEIDLLALMRPTRSPVLYIQMIGRGVRVNYADGYDLNTQEGRLEAIVNSAKPDCMIVDLGGVVATLGAIDKVAIRKTYQGEIERDEDAEGGAIMKICPSCGAECAASQRYCYSCSYCFIQLEDKASKKAVVSMDEEPEWRKVMSMMQSKHQTADSAAPSMMVTYATMQGNVREWVCFEHHKFPPDNKKRFAWDMACKWHNARLPDEPVPKNVWDASMIEYPQPSEILVKPNGKYWNVIDYKWDEVKEEAPIDNIDDFEIAF